MRRTEATLFTTRESSGYESRAVELTFRAGLVRQFGSGLYGFTLTGERIRQQLLEKIETEMNAIGAQKINLPQLNYRGIWDESGRWDSFGDEMFTLENRDGQEMCLAPSHEEGVVHLFEGILRSYEDLPLFCYQVGTKHRDDHARMGLLRTKEFTMKDAYSFHATEDSLDEYYERVREAYCGLFERLGIEFVIVDADNSVMGGSDSEEFVAPVDTGTVDLLSCETDACRFGVTDESQTAEYEAGEDCPECGGELRAGEGIEIAHIFKLATRYSEPMNLAIDLADGTRQAVLMASYGIGVERLIHTLLAQHSDEDGCRWPGDGADSVAPYTVSIIPLEYDGELAAVADVLYGQCDQAETLLFDDPDQTIGERFAESDLLGIPYKLVIGNNFRETGELELERRDGTTTYIKQGEVSGLFDGAVPN